MTETQTFKLTDERRQELATIAENFQQACATFAGPYEDGYKRLYKLAYGAEKGQKFTLDDVQWFKNWAREMIGNAEYLESELETAAEDFENLIDDYVQDDEYEEDED